MLKMHCGDLNCNRGNLAAGIFYEIRFIVQSIVPIDQLSEIHPTAALHF